MGMAGGLCSTQLNAKHILVPRSRIHEHKHTKLCLYIVLIYFQKVVNHCGICESACIKLLNTPHRQFVWLLPNLEMVNCEQIFGTSNGVAMARQYIYGEENNEENKSALYLNVCLVIGVWLHWCGYGASWLWCHQLVPRNAYQEINFFYLCMWWFIKYFSLVNMMLSGICFLKFNLIYITLFLHVS